jgi:hypothetical protein
VVGTRAPSLLTFSCEQTPRHGDAKSCRPTPIADLRDNLYGALIRKCPRQASGTRVVSLLMFSLGGKPPSKAASPQVPPGA